MSIDFSQYRIHDQKPEESGISSAKRHAARSGARILETALGLPGDISKAGAVPLNWVAKQTKKYLGFGKPKTEEELEEISKSVPTSERIRQFGEKATGGYLEPKSEAEKTADEFFQLATSLAIPGPKTAATGKILKGLGKAGGLSALGTGTKSGLKSMGVDENTANMASFASLAIPGLLKGRNPSATVKELYKEAETLLPKNAMVTGRHLIPSMKETISTLSKGTSTPSKAAALRTAKDILKKASSGVIKVDELTAFKRDINELMKDPENLRRGENFLKGLGKKVDESLKVYGKENPQWYQKYSTANDMYGGLANSKRASDFIGMLSGRYKKLIKNPITMVALGLSPIGFKKVALGFAGQKAYELMHRISTNKSLRKFYGNVVKEAAASNAKSTAHYLKKLDHEMEKEFPTIDWDQYKAD